MAPSAHRLGFIGFALALASSASAQETQIDPAWRDCTVVRIARDGARTVTPPSEAAGQSSPESSSASASASSHGTGHGPASSRSSVSASSSSHGPASASASASGDKRRSVTQTRDERGCVVTIDER